MTFGNQFSFKLSRGSTSPSEANSEEQKVESEETSLKTIKEEANDNVEDTENGDEKKSKSKGKKSKGKQKKANKRQSYNSDGNTAFSSLKAPSLAHPYSKLLWKINKFKSEEVEKQSKLIQESHNKLCHSNTEGTTRHGFRKNNVKPKIDKQGRPLEFKFVDCIGSDNEDKAPKKEGYRKKLREKRKKKKRKEKEKEKERKKNAKKDELTVESKGRSSEKEDSNVRESDGSSFLTFRSSGGSQKTEMGSVQSGLSNSSRSEREREDGASGKGDVPGKSTTSEESQNFSY